MKKITCKIIAMVIIGTLTSCGVYTFSGSTLASHLKTVDIPLFVNQSLKPGVAEEITQKLNRDVLSSNLLRIVAENGDATISGVVTAYSNTPYTFGVAEQKQVDVQQYVVRIVADVDFYDNKKNESLYKGSVTGEGIYDFATQTEEHGTQIAVDDLVKKILQSSVQSW